jgi:hypothetical protein|tara:strand:+ start:1617 stop:1775 length:159 start_codon:yes stop_codon:yes gene_type:complete
MTTKRKIKNTPIVIDASIHKLLKDFCKERGMKIGSAANAMIKHSIESIQRDK